MNWYPSTLCTFTKINLFVYASIHSIFLSAKILVGIRWLLFRCHFYLGEEYVYCLKMTLDRLLLCISIFREGVNGQHKYFPFFGFESYRSYPILEVLKEVLCSPSDIVLSSKYSIFLELRFQTGFQILFDLSGPFELLVYFEYSSFSLHSLKLITFSQNTTMMDSHKRSLKLLSSL